MFKHYICHVKIENEIKQGKPFGSNFEMAMVNLVYTNNWLAHVQKEFFAKYGLTSKQYNILRILRGAGKAISTSDIRERMLDKMSDVSRIVERLYKKGLVDKKTCPKDQRKVDVCLTNSSSDLLTKIDSSLEKWQSEVCNLSTNEAEELSRLLDKMRK